MARHSVVPRIFLSAVLLAAAGCSTSREETGNEDEVAPAARVPGPESGGLEGTSWRLVKFEGGDATVLTTADPSKYTFTFGS
ncbi:MAG TPA: hypothetical protein VF061_12230, partial [Gemmatimonadales bacterium]